MRASAHHPLKRTHVHAVRSRVARGHRAGSYMRRPAEPQELEMFSDRLDDAAEYQKIIKDFVLVHDAVCSADDYDS